MDDEYYGGAQRWGDLIGLEDDGYKVKQAPPTTWSRDRLRFVDKVVRAQCEYLSQDPKPAIPYLPFMKAVVELVDVLQGAEKARAMCCIVENPVVSLLSIIEPFKLPDSSKGCACIPEEALKQFMKTYSADGAADPAAIKAAYQRVISSADHHEIVSRARSAIASSSPAELPAILDRAAEEISKACPEFSKEWVIWHMKFNWNASAAFDEAVKAVPFSKAAFEDAMLDVMLHWPCCDLVAEAQGPKLAIQGGKLTEEYAFAHSSKFGGAPLSKSGGNPLRGFNDGATRRLIGM